MELSSGDVLIGLYIVVAIMLIIVLYHLLFIVVDLRKVLGGSEDITAQVEAVIMKPIAMADQIMEWVVQHIETLARRRRRSTFTGKDTNNIKNLSLRGKCHIPVKLSQIQTQYPSESFPTESGAELLTCLHVITRICMVPINRYIDLLVLLPLVNKF